MIMLKIYKSVDKIIIPICRIRCELKNSILFNAIVIEVLKNIIVSKK
jgi:hypothetical protein